MLENGTRYCLNCGNRVDSVTGAGLSEQPPARIQRPGNSGASGRQQPQGSDSRPRSGTSRPQSSARPQSGSSRPRTAGEPREAYVERAEEAGAKSRDLRRQRTFLVILVLSLCLVVAAVALVLSLLLTRRNTTPPSVSPGPVTVRESQRPTGEALPAQTPEPLQEITPGTVENPSEEQQIISDFRDTYQVYHDWFQARTGPQETVSKTDSATGIQVYDGASFRRLLLTVFSQRYTDAAMTYLKVREADQSLRLGAMAEVDEDYDLTKMDPQIEVISCDAASCHVFVSWVDTKGIQHAYHVSGTRSGGRWVFDDLTNYVHEGAYGGFGSYRTPAATAAPVTAATPSPTAPPAPSPTENTRIASYKYIANLVTWCSFRSSPSEDSANVIDRLYLGTSVGYIESYSATYAKVSYNGRIGYVMHRYLSDSPPDLGNTTVLYYQYVVNTAGTVSFRSAPSGDDSAVVFEVDPGTRVGFIEAAGSYARVAYYDGSHIYYGYLPRQVLSDSANPPTPTATAPATTPPAPPTTQPVTEVPVTDPPSENPAVQLIRSLAAESDGGSDNRGELVDLDGNGTKELILMYVKDDVCYAVIADAEGQRLDRWEMGDQQAREQGGAPGVGRREIDGTEYLVACRAVYDGDVQTQYDYYTFRGGSLSLKMTVREKLDGDNTLRYEKDGADLPASEFQQDYAPEMLVRYGAGSLGRSWSELIEALS